MLPTAEGRALVNALRHGATQVGMGTVPCFGSDSSTHLRWLHVLVGAMRSNVRADSAIVTSF
jgi:hypothetical protein